MPKDDGVRIRELRRGGHFAPSLCHGGAAICVDKRELPAQPGVRHERAGRPGCERTMAVIVRKTVKESAGDD